jgi:hypothetical protein
MAKRTKAQEAERQEAIAKLRERVKPGKQENVHNATCGDYALHCETL